MNKVLVAIDDSAGALKAVDFVGRQFGGSSALKVTVLHVIPNLPAPLWDDGHILTEEEREARRQVIEKWMENQQLTLKKMFDKAVESLTGKGIGQNQVEIKTVTDTFDVAGSILNEMKEGGYQMLVVGRRGYSQAQRLVMGSVAQSIVNRGTGIAVCSVE